jgi:hypothetical protein
MDDWQKIGYMTKMQKYWATHCMRNEGKCVKARAKFS